MEKDPKLQSLYDQKRASDNIRSQYENRWVRSINLCKGKFREGTTTSKIRNTEKIFFRKIWASIWRLVAAMYQTFQRDPDSFKIEGRDTSSDPHKAKVLQQLTRYRKARLINRGGMFLKFIWAYWDIFKYGVAFGKFTWVYKEDDDGKVLIDEPEYVAYPPEQVYPDMSVATKDKMRYCHFLNYMTLGEMKERGYKNLDEVEETTVDSNAVRDARHAEGDPLNQNYQNTNYAGFSGSGTVGGTYPDEAVTEERDTNNSVYRVYESFWIEDEVIKFGIHSDFSIWLTPGKEDYNDSPYGDEIPLVMGLCLTEPHQLIGEGFPEPLEAPQESFNYNLNMRKDGISAALAGMTIVDSNAGVDIASLLNRRKLGVVIAENVNGVRHEQVPDVTSSAYAESQADESMMEEMSGITPSIQGREDSSKATVAQINNTESNAKIDLFTAIVGDTFQKSWHRELARQISMFETDETAIRVANEKFREEDEVVVEDIYEFDMEVDCIIDVGAASGREAEIKKTFLLMDRGIMIMQAVQGLIGLGVQAPNGFQLPNMSELYLDVMSLLGKKDRKKYVLTVGQPPAPAQGGAGGGGANPNGQLNMPNESNMIQQGSAGGI